MSNPMLPKLSLAAWVLFMAVGAWGHATGVSKVDVTLTADTLVARVDVNRDDLFYALKFRPLSEIPKSEIVAHGDRIAYYFQTRIEVKFDGNSVTDMHVLEWRKKVADPTLKMDSAALADTTIVLKVAYLIPKGAKRLEFAPRLFAELEAQPLSHVRIYFQGQEIKRRFMAIDDRLLMPIEPDSLAAAYAIATRPAPAAGSPEASAASGEESVVGRFLWLGYTHILPEGVDHILFVLGLFFFSIMLRPLFIQVTAFTVAHSITLGLSLFNIISLPSRVIDPLIALSIVIVAVENIFFRKLRPSRFLVVFGFGLVHGMGFATVLKGLGLPEGQFFKVLVSFNVGVEFGQLTIIAAAAALTAWMWKKPWYFQRVVIPVSALISGIGLFWFIQRMLLIRG